MSVPAIPQGPLLVTNITATRCQLKWRPRANNIEILVNFYEVQYQVDGGYSWEICNNTEINCWCIVRSYSCPCHDRPCHDRLRHNHPSRNNSVTTTLLNS